MERRCVEAAVRLGWRSAALAELGDVLGLARRLFAHARTLHQSCVPAAVMGDELSGLEQPAEARVRAAAPQEAVEEVVRQLRHREQRRDDQRTAANIEARAE